MKNTTKTTVIQDGVKVTIEIEIGVTLDKVVMAVGQVIKGCGFCPAGQLDFVEED